MTLSLLVTGFSAFPRAPVNPSQELIAMLSDRPAPEGVRLSLRVLPVEYGRVPSLLADLGREVQPDIAIHFGLADTARGFRLESIARNRCSMVSVDASGNLPATELVCEGPAKLPGMLPLREIAGELRKRGLPVQRSANAGAYLCNYTFYLSRSGSLPDFRPPMSGFVHIPYLDDQLAALPPARRGGLFTLTRDQLLDGAEAIIRQCVVASRRLDKAAA